MKAGVVSICGFNASMGGYYSAADDSADSSAAAAEAFTRRVGAGREIPSFFIL
jgi:hypothetical protein